MASRAASRWMLLALAAAVLVVLALWQWEGPPVGDGDGEVVGRSRPGERAPTPDVPSVQGGGGLAAPPARTAAPSASGDARSGTEDGLKRTLHVRVVEEGQPERGVKNAVVKALRITPEGGGFDAILFGASARSVDDSTNEDGRAILERVTRGAAYLRVIAAGFALATRPVPAADQDATEIVVELSRGLLVAGKVLKADGTAAVGAVVRGTQQRQWIQARTDGSGAFRPSGFVPGLVSLHATWRDAEAVWEGEATVDAGDLDAEVRLGAAPAGRRIRLLVKGADGLPVPTASWHAKDERLMNRYGEGAGEVVGGEAVVAASPRLQWLSIDGPKDKDGGDLPWAPVLVGPLGDRGGDLEVVMPRTFAPTGTVRDEDGKPLDGVAVNVMPLVVQGEGEEFVYEDWWFAKTDTEGRFKVEGMGPGRVQVDAQTVDGTNWPKLHVTVPCGPLDLVIRKRRVLKGSLRHTDGSPAPEAVLYRRGAPTDSNASGWNEEKVASDGTFHVWTYGPGIVRLRAGLAPTGPEDMTESEVAADASAEAVVLTVPQGRDVVVLVPDWPQGEAGFARVMNGPNSRGVATWIVNKAARFKGLDPRSPLAFHCGPGPDGRIGFSSDILAGGPETTVPLVVGRTIRGRARGFPVDARPTKVWADSGEFEVRGELGADGTLRVQGIPPGTCRVCAVFKRGKETWCGSTAYTGGSDPVEIEVSRRDETELWLVPRR